jgi:hypothetical protein
MVRVTVTVTVMVRVRVTNRSAFVGHARRKVRAFAVSPCSESRLSANRHAGGWLESWLNDGPRDNERTNI